MSKIKKAWEEIWNSESEDGTWDFVNNCDEIGNDIRLMFFNYENQGTNEEVLKEHITLKLTKDQLESLLEFCNKLNKKIE